jgi:hypothetical protein
VLSDGFRQAGTKLYEQVEARTVLDGEATAEKLDGVFSELGAKVRLQDVFVFFLAGHGKTVTRGSTSCRRIFVMPARIRS